MEKVFERKTQNGDKLECFIMHTDISAGYHQMPKVAFFVNGQERRKQSMWEFASIKALKDNAATMNKRGVTKAGQEYLDLVKKLEQSGSNCIWNLQVALYGNERERIENALKAAFEKRIAQAEELVATNPQKIQYTLLEDSCVAVAQNEFFIYQWLNRHSGASPKVDGLDDSERRKFNLFVDSVDWLSKRNLPMAPSQKRNEQNPHLENLSLQEIRKKEKEWDETYNEGQEGFNPYRNYL